MSSRSSRSSKMSSQSSDTSRSTSTYASYRVPSTAGHRPQRPDARSLRDIQEEIETYELQIANAEAAKRHALRTIRDAETRERALAQERIKAQRKRDETMQQLNSNALNILHNLSPATIEERSPDDYADRSLTLKTPKSDGSQSGRSNNSSKSKKGRNEVIGIGRRARPKTIWGTPAWA